VTKEQRKELIETWKRGPRPVDPIEEAAEKLLRKIREGRK
jgi:hypothetical protein